MLALHYLCFLHIVHLCTLMLDFAAVSQAFLERKLGRIIHFWDPVMTCFAAIGTQGGGWNAEFGSLAQRYPALTALFTLLDEALCVCGGGGAVRGVSGLEERVIKVMLK